MTSTSIYCSISALNLLFFIGSSSSFYKFALGSEFVWLCLLVYCSYSGTVLDDIQLLSLPFLVLVLTAVEAVVIWSLLLCFGKLS